MKAFCDTHVRGERGGWAMVATLAVLFVISTLMAFLLIQAQDQAKAERFSKESIQALYEALGKLEMARVQIANSEYDGFGRNKVVKKALDRGGIVPNTDVEIAPLTGENGSWYVLTARANYDSGRSERVVRQIFRDRDYFSSYNIFVDAHPVGVAGAPIGAIHTNKWIEFWFPNGLYRHSITAVEGGKYKAGATLENTTIVGPCNLSTDPISLDLVGDKNFGFKALKLNALPDYKFSEKRDVRFTLVREGLNQYLDVELFTKPEVRKKPYQKLVGWKPVNPRIEYEEVEETYIDGYKKVKKKKTKWIKKKVPVPKKKPVYRTEKYKEKVPVYRKEKRWKKVPVYGKKKVTKLVPKKVWVPDPPDSSGSIVIGGDGSELGHWETQYVEQEVEETVIIDYKDEPYYVDVLDHYDEVEKTREVIDHYDEYIEEEWRDVPVQVEEEVDEPIYKKKKKKVPKKVYDYEPIYKTYYYNVYIPREKIREERLPAPENGVVYAGGDVIGIAGEVVSRLTIGSQGKIFITGNIQYKDEEGDTAYLNGTDPTEPYVPNPDYGNTAVLGLVAQEDVIYSYQVPNKFEINASLMAIEGRVGIDGITLDEKGDTVLYNYPRDQWGRLYYKPFAKTSIRRLGGVVTHFRPVDVMVRKGSKVSGFVGKGSASAFDSKVLAAPPPFFLARPVPRFFAVQIGKYKGDPLPTNSCSGSGPISCKGGVKGKGCGNGGGGKD